MVHIITARPQRVNLGEETLMRQMRSSLAAETHRCQLYLINFCSILRCRMTTVEAYLKYYSILNCFISYLTSLR
jgi:hypothetical protein